VGRCFPLDRGAASKALLADGPASGDTWRRATAQLSAERLAQLRHDIESLRQTGFAVTRGETVDGSSSIATSLRSGSSGTVAAALSVAGPLSRFSDERVATYAPLLLEAATRISRDLGALYAMPQGVDSR
jgi:DNA-binding IclR family transcriptional regulator